jgi:hypothetical protein
VLRINFDQGGNMQKWEYLEITVTYIAVRVMHNRYYKEQFGITPEVIMKNGKWLDPLRTEKQKKSYGGDFTRAFFPKFWDTVYSLNSLGAEGWEIVSVLGKHGEDVERTFFLKRPLEG